MAQTDELVKIRLRLDMQGQFENESSPRRGDVVECPRSHAERYLAAGYAQYDLTGPLGKAYEPSH
jgi:hypothetical protein